MPDLTSPTRCEIGLAELSKHNGRLTMERVDRAVGCVSFPFVLSA